MGEKRSALAVVRLTPLELAYVDRFARKDGRNRAAWLRALVRREILSRAATK